MLDSRHEIRGALGSLACREEDDMASELGRAAGAFWAKAAVAGMFGGVAMAMYEMATAVMDGMSVWAPMNMIAATMPAFRPPAPGFDPASALTGMGLHMVTSAFWALAFAALVLMLAPRILSSVGQGALAGVGYGVAVWLVMGLGIGPLLDPALAMANPIHMFVGHLVYGGVLGAVLVAWTGRRDLAVTFAPETRVEEPTLRR